MCTTASPTEIVLIGAVLGSALVGAPTGLAFLARRGGAGRFLVAGALLAMLGALVAARVAPSLADPRPLDAPPALAALALLAASALWLWSARTGGPRARSAAFALTLAGAALGAAIVAMAIWPDPGACERLMRPPTPSPS